MSNARLGPKQWVLRKQPVRQRLRAVHGVTRVRVRLRLDRDPLRPGRADVQRMGRLRPGRKPGLRVPVRVPVPRPGLQDAHLDAGHAAVEENNILPGCPVCILDANYVCLCDGDFFGPDCKQHPTSAPTPGGAPIPHVA